MATITKSIGTTPPHDYSTITLWEAALGGAAGGAGNDAIGECYNDAAFDESPNVNDGTPDSITLRAATGEEHDGTAGTGARIVRSIAAAEIFRIATAVPFTIETMELDANRQTIAATVNVLNCVNNPVTQRRMHRCLVHGVLSTVGTVLGIIADGAMDVQNTFIYNIDSQASGTANVRGIQVGAQSSRIKRVLNVTVHNTTKNGTGTATGIFAADDAQHTIQNCIVTDTNNEGAGAAVDYSPASFSNATVDHNLASDTTASGTGSLDSKTSANQFVSNVEDSEDLKLKTGADAIDAGTDLGTTPDDIEFDIIGRDRDSEGDTWDMGADEYVAVATGQPTMRRWGGVPYMSPGPVLAGRSW